MNEDNKERWKIIKPVVSPDEIIEDLKKKVEEEPQNNNNLKELALFLYKQERNEESFDYLKKLLDLGIRDADILSAYGHILLIRGKYREAKTYLNEALTKNENDSVAQNDMLQIEKIEGKNRIIKRKIIKYAAIASSVVIVLIIVSIIFTKDPFSFLTPNKLYKGVVAFYNEQVSGTIVINSDPSGGEIIIDSRHTNKNTPAEIELKEGSHTIKIYKAGYISTEKTIQVIRHQKQEISVVLDLSPGILSIDINPAGAKVYVNGNYKGTSPVDISLKAGTYKLTVSKENYKTYNTSITIASGEKKVVTYSLTSLLSYLDIESSPQSAEIYLNENYKGVTPLTLQIIPGSYKITLKKDGYEDYTTTVSVYESKTKKITATLKVSGEYKFKQGEYVIALDDLNTRSSPSLNGSVLKTVKKGNIGIIQISPAQYADGYYWWKVKWLDYSPTITGWSVGNYLESSPYIGFFYLEMSEDVAKYYSVQFIEGLFITDVASNSPAYKAGIRPGDILITFDGKRIKNTQELREAVASRKIGDKVEINFVRSGVIIKFQVILEARPRE